MREAGCVLAVAMLHDPQVFVVAEPIVGLEFLVAPVWSRTVAGPRPRPARLVAHVDAHLAVAEGIHVTASAILENRGKLDFLGHARRVAAWASARTGPCSICSWR